MLLWGTVIFIFLTCGFLSFLDLWVYNFCQIWKFGALFLQTFPLFLFLRSFIFVDSNYTSIKLFKVVLQLTDILLIKKNFSVFHYWIVLFLSLNSLICPSAIAHLLLIPIQYILISRILVFISKSSFLGCLCACTCMSVF